MSKTRLDEELFAHELDDPAIVAQVASWLSESRRFSAFVTKNLPKVRKKLRTARGPQDAGEVLFELEVAFRLSRHKALDLVYEPFASSKERGPDFAVSHNGKPWLLLEVTRLSRAGADRLALRLARTVAGKLGQFQQGEPNVLLIGFAQAVEEKAFTGSELEDGARRDRNAIAGALKDLARTAERADSEFFTRVGLRDRSDFFRRYDRLSLILVTSIEAGSGTVAATGTGPGAGLVEWVNPRAKSKLVNPGPASLVRALT